MAMRCFGRARFAVGTPRALVLSLFRAVDLAGVLRGGDFFCAAVRTAARDVGFCLAFDVLPFDVVGERYHRSLFVGWARSVQSEHSVYGSQFGRLDQLGSR